MNVDRSLFQHEYRTRVRFYHVDRQNIVYHLWYLYFLEEGRLEYLRTIGFPLNEQAFVTEHRFYIAHNAIDYFASATFDDELLVYSRIASVGTSSLRFEHAIVQERTGALLTTGDHVLVHVNVASNQPERIPDHLRDLIRRFEGGRVTFSEKR